MAVLCAGLGSMVAGVVSYRVPNRMPNRVILREAPELPRLPVSPGLPFNLTIGALAGLALSPLLALVVLSLVPHRGRPASESKH
jgi:capsular polysaccharide biosynthesis protein